MNLRKSVKIPIRAVLISLFCLSLAGTALADPQLSSWFTANSGKYAELVLTDADLAANTIRTTWNGPVQTGQNGVQSIPTYSGIHEISYDDDWVYIRTTGLGGHVMGPWYINETRTTLFPNLPVNTASLHRFPRTPTIPVSKQLTGNGAIGYFVDGVSMFDPRDAFSYNSGSGNPGSESNPGTGIWRRDAGFVEKPTFDYAQGHQPGAGQYHYHLNPRGLRYMLGDNILFDDATKTYDENLSNSNLTHSPIVGWMNDGLPLYGPYGYSEATNAFSGIRRMTSGYALRSAPDRTTYPEWAVRQKGLGSNVLTTDAGPPISASRPLGRYCEDYDYLGDLGFIQGTDFDLNEQNVRWCVTPEFPTGTWAYFICIDANGAPIFPYHINFFYGDPVGGSQTTVPATNTILFEGGPEIAEHYNSAVINDATGDITLLWNAAEGGTYTVECSSNLASISWTTLGSISSTSSLAGVVDSGRLNTDENQFYRITQNSVRAFDDAGFDYDNKSIFDAVFPTPLPDFESITSVTINGVSVNWVSYDDATGIIGLAFDDSTFPDGIYSALLTYELSGGGSTQMVSSSSYTVGHRNILVMIVDDWAIDASSLYNTNANVFLPNMPHLQTLADNGLLFSHAYAQPVCSPTRATMMTGRQVFQHGVGFPGEENANFSEDEITLPEVFTLMGSPYAKASVGKWHLGGGDTGYSTRGGWDEFYGITGVGVNSYTNWIKNSNGISSNVTTYSTTDQVNEAVKFITTQDGSDNPWLMWAAFNAPHTPFHEPPASLAPVGGYSTNSSGSTDLDNYIHMLEALDTEIGRLLESVDLNNTHIMIIGDNGTPGQAVQDPYGNGHAKGSLYEGGTHVPFIVRSPDLDASLVGQTTDKPVHCIDLFSTIIELGGIDEAAVPGLAAQNVLSSSIVPILKNTDSADRSIILEMHDSAGRGIILDGYPDYKLLIFGEPDDANDIPSFEFYNIGAPAYDLNEENPLSIAGLAGTALAAYNACIAKDTALGGGYSDQPTGNFDTIYIELPMTGTPPVPGLFRPDGTTPINVTSITVDGVSASFSARVDYGILLSDESDDEPKQYWVRAIVPEAAGYTTAHVIFPNTPTGTAREYDSISISVKP